MKRLILSVRAADCEWSYTKGTGKGGQKRNKTSSAVHCFHRPSGAHGYSEASRSQRENKEAAFLKMAHSKEFETWRKMEVAKRLGILDEIEKKVEYELQHNIVVEVVKDGKWTPE